MFSLGGDTYQVGELRHIHWGVEMYSVGGVEMYSLGELRHIQSGELRHIQLGSEDI